MENKEHYYLCIDLKSFYASVECVERKQNSLTSNLVVADPTRGKGAICLAVSSHLKQLGVKNRCRLFEIPKNIDYIIAIPRMKKYIEYSSLIYSIYLKYIAKEDIYVYSIDECFLDVTSYLMLYEMTVEELAKKMIDDVYQTTKICATAGIGTNLFLAKVSLDIIAKHSKSNIGYLNEKLFQEKIWHYQPITDIWNIGPGIAKRLKDKFNIVDLYGVAHESEEKLYNEFGVNAEFLIDHSKGIESCSIADIHQYKAKSNSLSNGQVLFEDYNFEDGLLVLKEMVDLQVREMVGKHLVCDSISLSIHYSKEVRKPSRGVIKLNEITNSYKIIKEYFIELYKKIVDSTFMIRKINIGFNNVVDETFKSFNLFVDEQEEEKEKNLQLTMLKIQEKFGKNSVLKGMNIQKKSTTKKRNKLIGGHNAE